MYCLPDQRDNYPYFHLGYDLKTMCEAFAGYGSDVLAGGVRVSARSQQLMAMNFLKTIQKSHGKWTVNEVTTYNFVMNATILGELVGVKDVAHELGMAMSTTSHIVLRLEDLEFLESYRCIDDRRRKMLRIHPKVVNGRVKHRQDIWAGQRLLLEQVLTEDQITD